jgi:hypothetical protein
MSREFPILFNCWKHHAGFIKTQICRGGFSENELKSRLSNLWYIKDSPTDLYLGNIEPDRIKALVFDEVSRKNLIIRENYLCWMAENSNYQKMLLPDQSSWILRASYDPLHFIHIHPARDSQHCIRVKGNTLKTAVVSQIIAKGMLDSTADNSLINEIRFRHFGLSPLKGEQPGELLQQMLDLFKCLNQTEL